MNDKYLHSTLEDFLLDDVFIDWVLNRRNHLQWESWLKQNPQCNEKILEARKLIGGLSFKDDGSVAGRKEEVWNRIETSTVGKEISIKKKTRRTFLYAASVAAIVSFFTVLLWPDSSVVFRTEDSLAQMITLPAESKIRIEPSSQVSYKKNKWSTSRDVMLDGYAHFEVTKGVPFTVNTDNGQVTVLGTEFDVISKSNSFYVKVEEGRVQASSGNYDEILTANMAFYKNPQWEGEFAIRDQWKTESVQFVFDRQPLQSAIQALSLYYNLNFDSSQISEDILYSGTFRSSDSLESSLQAVFWPLNVDFSVTGDSVRLSNR